MVTRERASMATTVTQKVDVSMVSLKWGDVLSILFPGVVALYAISPYFPALSERIQRIEQITPTFGLVLLIAACLAGGILGAITRILWEPFWLMRRCRVSREVMQRVTANKDMYERLVENSYKYVTFYSNLAWATIILFFARMQQGARICSAGSLILLLVVIILIRASHVQWTYYVKSMEQFYREEMAHVEKRTATGDKN
jgi:hypothetical protein